MGKGQFQVGDMAVYIPIDSVLSEDLNAYLFPPDSKIRLENNRRIKTIKIRGMLSQGMLVPWQSLYSKYPKIRFKGVGDDVADVLGITKYEPPAPKYQSFGTGTKAKRLKHPDFREYTDISNIRFWPTAFYDGDEVYVSEKLHGTSVRMAMLPPPYTGFKQLKYLWKARRFKALLQTLFGRAKAEFHYGSRQVDISISSTYRGFYGFDLYGKVARAINAASILQPGEILFGEIVGHKIQKGYEYGHKPEQHTFYAYDVIKDGKYLDADDFIAWCDERGIKRVPMLHLGKLDHGMLDAFVGGPSTIHAPTEREGIVVKPRKETFHPGLGRKVLKHINPEYLLSDQTDFH